MWSSGIAKKIHALFLSWVSLLLFSCSAEADIAVVAHVDNPVNSISLSTLRKLYLGKISQLLGGSEKVVLLDVEPANQLFAQFYESALGYDKARVLRLRAQYLFSGKGALPRQMKDQQAVMDFLKNNLHGVGYIDAERVSDGLKVLLKIATP